MTGPMWQTKPPTAESSAPGASAAQELTALQDRVTRLRQWESTASDHLKRLRPDAFDRDVLRLQVDTMFELLEDAIGGAAKTCHRLEPNRSPGQPRPCKGGGRHG